MCEIPPMKCQECGAPMEYIGGPSDSNIFIMVCTNSECRRQETCYMGPTQQKKEIKAMDEQEVLQILGKVGAVITDSHIVYTSGKHGTAYINKDAVYPHTKETSHLCRAIAEHFVGDGVEVIIAPAIGGVILSQWTAHHLSEITGREVFGVYVERENKESVLAEALENSKPVIFKLPFGGIDDGPSELTLLKREKLIHRKDDFSFIIKRGYDKIVAGKNVLVVEDVLTTGGSAKKVVEAARNLGGNIVGLGVLCNRGGITPQDVANPPKLFALVNVKLDAWDEADCPLCAQNVPINTDVGKGRQYLLAKKQIEA